MMKKRLEEMSLEELWRLFPVILKEYDPAYPVWYEEERSRILKIVGKENIFRISHIGSTAVTGLLSKPTVDILLELTAAASVALASERLKTEWILMSENREPLKLAFNKGYTEDGFAERVFHLHVRRAGDWDELYFRDYLRGHGETAEAYGRLKQELLPKYCHNRDAYTAAKAEFVKKYTAEGRALYADRYAVKGM